jgi:ABC-type Na+ efflux pump permease subunit
MTWPAVVALILMFLAMLSRSPYFLLYLFFGLAPFGSLSMLAWRYGRGEYPSPIGLRGPAGL